MPQTPNRSTTPLARPRRQPPLSPAIATATPKRQSTVSSPIRPLSARRDSKRKSQLLPHSPLSSPPASSPRKPPQSPSKNRDNIKVIARFRPESDTERVKQGGPCAVLDASTVRISGESFVFDRTFDATSTQKEVFEFSVSQTVDDLFNGYNGTVLAYGQTGSGKTYTMMGDLDNTELKGVTPRIAELIFQRITECDDETECTVTASYMEIYLEQIRDLLTTNREKQLSIHEDGLNGVHVRNLTRTYLGSSGDVYKLLERGSELRAVASTDMNLESSRSHAILQIDLTQENLRDGIKRSKLFLVDLAGSEKVSKTGAMGQTLEEAKKINSSLSSLGNVISALTDSKSPHIPYRDSKLTRILQESLGGNSRTSLIINCSPLGFNEAETLSTLRFGSRAKAIKNKAYVNAEPSQLDLVRQIEHLKRLNEDHELRIKEMGLELDLWKKGINKVEIIIPSALRDQESSEDEDTVVESTVSGTRKAEYLENRVRELTQILSVSPSFANPTPEEVPLVLQLQDSQAMNAALLSDLENKCLLLIDLQTQLDSRSRNSRGSSAHEDREFAMERTFEQLTLQVNELEDRNHQLSQEVKGLRSIAQTRSERIHTLEKLLEDSRGRVQKESKSFEYNFFSLRDRLLSVKKLSSPPSADPDPGGHFDVSLEHKNGAGVDDHKCISSDHLIGRDTDEGKGRRRTSTGAGSLTSGSMKHGLNLNVVQPMSVQEDT